MSGHSKWSTIKRAKGATDQKRGAIFSKLAKAITVAAKEGGGDESANFKLRLAISKAKQANMPKNNIKRAIESGVGGGGGKNYKEDLYEAYGPGGSALIIETLSDNVNRTIAEIKYALSKYNGKLAEKNSSLRLFETIGLITLSAETITNYGKNNAELELIELGANEINEEEGDLVATFTLTVFNKAADALSKKNISAETENITRPYTFKTLSAKDEESLKKLIDVLEEIEDVETIFTNVYNV